MFDGQDITPLSPRSATSPRWFQFPVIYDTMTVGQKSGVSSENRGVPKAEIDSASPRSAPARPRNPI